VLHPLVKMAIRGYLGIDNGTQGLSIIFCDENNLHVLATGEGAYGMVAGLEDGNYEQFTDDWDNAMVKSMEQIRQKLGEIQVLAIGIAGQMHGEVLAGDDGKCLGPVRIWCDARNEEEGHELTSLFNSKVPKRSTCARFLWTCRNRPARAKATRHITTPAGWISYRLTGEWNLGIGDASGIFPIDQSTLDYDNALLKQFDVLVNDVTMPTLKSILPRVCTAGEDAGCLSETGAKLLGLSIGIPVAGAEGDQPAALAGSLIAQAGMVSMSFGTSVVANSVGDRPFHGVSPGVDHFCAADGKPINMIWIRNGTTFMNQIVAMYAELLDCDEHGAGFAAIMPKLLEADADCGGLVAMPFMDDEPGLGVKQGGTAMLIGLSRQNLTAGNVAKAALLAPIFNLKLGSTVLDEQDYPRTEIILSGGVIKTPECGQILADVFHTPVSLLDAGVEGSAFGAAIMANFRRSKITGSMLTWAEFLDQIKVVGGRRFEPNQEAVEVYEKVFGRYQKLIALQPMLCGAMNEQEIGGK
jgi:sugar (pentulose or hexulose) kinase